MSEVQGFSLDCEHDLELLPVVDFSYTFRCGKCRGIERISWQFVDPGIGLDRLTEFSRDWIAKMDVIEIPEWA